MTWIISPNFLFMIFIGVPLLIGGVVIYLLGVSSLKKNSTNKDKESMDIDDIIDQYKPKK